MQAAPDAHAVDPFGEFQSGMLQFDATVLGARVEFRSRSAELIELVRMAYDGLPAHDLGLLAEPLRVELSLVEDDSLAAGTEPPTPRICGGAGLFGAVIDTANSAHVAPKSGGAAVSISTGLLRNHAHYARYELLEFAVFMLTSRTQGLVALHAACVGHEGHAALLIGDSGTGKTTLSLQSLLDGLEFLSEDAVFIDPASLRATGVANYLHPRFDALRFVESEAHRALIASSPVIRRRSGVEKYELDLRTSGGVLAGAPLKLAAVVLLSQEAAGDGPLLRSLDAATAIERMRAGQPYAAQLHNWSAFAQACAELPLLELRRGAHPREGVAALRRLLIDGDVR